MASSRRRRYQDLGDEVWEERGGQAAELPTAAQGDDTANNSGLHRIWVYISNAVGLMRPRKTMPPYDNVLSRNGEEERDPYDAVLSRDDEERDDDDAKSRLNSRSIAFTISQSLPLHTNENTHGLTSRGPSSEQPDSHTEADVPQTRSQETSQNKHKYEAFGIPSPSVKRRSQTHDPVTIPLQAAQNSLLKPPVRKSHQAEQVQSPAECHAEVLPEAKYPESKQGVSAQPRNRFGWQNRPRMNVAAQGEHSLRHQIKIEANAATSTSKANIKQPRPAKSNTPHIPLPLLALGGQNEPTNSSFNSTRGPPGHDQSVQRRKRPAIQVKPDRDAEHKVGLHCQSRNQLASNKATALTKPRLSPQVRTAGPTRPAPLPRNNRRSTLSLSPRRKSTHRGPFEREHEHAHAHDDTKVAATSASIIKSPRMRLLSTFNAHSPLTPKRRFRHCCANVLCGKRESHDRLYRLCAQCDSRYCTQLCAHIDRYRHKDVCRRSSSRRGSMSAASTGMLEEVRHAPEVPAPPVDSYNFSSKAKKLFAQHFA